MALQTLTSTFTLKLQTPSLVNSSSPTTAHKSVDLLGITFGTVQLELFAWLSVRMVLHTIQVQPLAHVFWKDSFFLSMQVASHAPSTAGRATATEAASAAVLAATSDN